MYRHPDVKAPRCKSNYTPIFTIDLCKNFRKAHPEYKDIPDKELNNIVKVFNTSLWKTVIELRDGIDLPEGLGTVFIGTCNVPKRCNTDHVVSMKYDQKIRCRNFESDNFLAKIFYTNYMSRYKFINRELWKFKGVREFTREVGKEYPKNWKKYLQVDNFVLISRVYREALKRNYFKGLKPDMNTEYDEFAMN